MTTLSNAKKNRGEYTEHRQRKALRDELKGIIDYVFDNWDEIERESKAAGRGFTTGSGEPSGGEGAGSVVEMAAFRPADAGEHAKEWLSLANEMIGMVRAVERKAWLVLPNTGSERRRAGDRKTTVEQCKGCYKPILDGRLKRIDGEPYHKDSCYYRAWRAAKKAQGELPVNPVRDVDTSSIDDLRDRRELPPER